MADWDSFENIDTRLVAKRIKERRADLGITQVSLAKLAEVSQQSICALERGSIKLPRALPRIAAVLNTTPKFLITGRESDDPPVFTAHDATELESRLDSYNDGELPSGWRYVKAFNKDFSGFSIVVTDEGMSPAFKEKDIALVSTASEITPGDLVLLSKNEKVYVRRIKLNSEDMLQSTFIAENNMFPDINGADQIYGKVVEVIRFF
jgi:transcriptional regulator with XRE-family HTH domain